MRNTKPARPSFTDRPRRGQSRPYAVHEHNPAGSKLVRSFYRAKHGMRESYEKSVQWYRRLKVRANNAADQSK